MNLGAIRQALADAVGTSELRSYAYVPENPSTPCAVVGSPQEMEYHQTAGRPGLTRIELPLTLVLGRMNSERAQQELDDFLSVDGENSILKRVEEDTTLGGLVHTLMVQRAESFYSYEDKYIGMDITVEIYA